MHKTIRDMEGWREKTLHSQANYLVHHKHKEASTYGGIKKKRNKQTKNSYSVRNMPYMISKCSVSHNLQKQNHMADKDEFQNNQTEGGQQFCRLLKL